MRFLVLFAVVFFSCQGSSKRSQKNPTPVAMRCEAYPNHYFQDPRTGICFVSHSDRWSSKLTYVPCTKKVLEQIKKCTK